MKVVVCGLGVQGKKRVTFAGKDVVATVDPVAPDATHRAIVDVPLASYDAVCVCTPDTAKREVLTHLLAHGKHVMVEKPLHFAPPVLRELGALARSSGALLYTAYNHRFEPHFVRVRDAIAAGRIGRPYVLKMSYGNGTARDVRDSAWRDRGNGVLGDLGSHLLDSLRFFLGDRTPDAASFEPWSASRFENKAFDHVVFAGKGERLTVVLEATLLAWKNTFSLDVTGELGSLHVDCLCKWGPSTFTQRTRKLPSGKPVEERVVLEQPDPTWKLEYDHFARLVAGPDAARAATEKNVENDAWIGAILSDLSTQLGVTET